MARRFGVSLSTVQRWCLRAGNRRLDRVDFGARPRGGGRRATDAATEDLVLELRRELHEASALGECGAFAIRKALEERAHSPIPSVRTIGRILARRGALDGRRRLRRPPPPRAWHLPVAADALAEVDSFDIVEGLRIKGGDEVEVLNAISLFGGLVQSWPVKSPVRASTAMELILSHWKEHGLPAYAHFDNDTIFQGAHQHRDSIGRVMRLCLALGVIPVFAPPREQGFQACIESFNGRWQAKVWARFHHGSLDELTARSARYIAALNARNAARREAAPARRPVPRDFQLDLSKKPRGEIVYIRRTSESGTATILGHQFTADPNWPQRLVRATVDLDEGTIEFHALRRKEPAHQQLLSSHHYRFPDKPFAS